MEYLRAAAGQLLALSDRVAGSLSSNYSRPNLTATPPLVLLVLAPGLTMCWLKIEEEWNSLQRALAGLQGQGWLRVERLPAPTPEALLDRLRGDGVHLLHFMGHGYFDAGTQTGGVVLEDAAGRAAFVPAAQLGTIVCDHESLRLVFFNACEGAGDGDNAFAGVAQQPVIQGPVLRCSSWVDTAS